MNVLGKSDSVISNEDWDFIYKDLDRLEELKKGFDLLEPYFYLFDQHKYNNNMSEYSNYRYVLIDCEGYYNFITKEQFYLLKKLGIKEYLI